MILEFHDSEEGATLSGRLNIDYDYQAEEIVQDVGLRHVDIVKFILADDQGQRAVWEKNGVNGDSITLTEKSPRFGGEWAVGLAFTLEDHKRKYGE